MCRQTLVLKTGLDFRYFGSIHIVVKIKLNVDSLGKRKRTLVTKINARGIIAVFARRAVCKFDRAAVGEGQVLEDTFTDHFRHFKHGASMSAERSIREAIFVRGRIKRHVRDVERARNIRFGVRKRQSAAIFGRNAKSTTRSNVKFVADRSTAREREARGRAGSHINGTREGLAAKSILHREVDVGAVRENERRAVSARKRVRDVAIGTVNRELARGAGKRNAALAKRLGIVDRNVVVKGPVRAEAGVGAFDHDDAVDRQAARTLEGVVAECKERAHRLVEAREVNGAPRVDAQCLGRAEAAVVTKDHLNVVREPGLTGVAVLKLKRDAIRSFRSPEDNVALFAMRTIFDVRGKSDRIIVFGVKRSKRQPLPIVIIPVVEIVATDLFGLMKQTDFRNGVRNGERAFSLVVVELIGKLPLDLSNVNRFLAATLPNFLFDKLQCVCRQ